jgi:hypothetical protein
LLKFDENKTSEFWSDKSEDNSRKNEFVGINNDEDDILFLQNHTGSIADESNTTKDKDGIYADCQVCLKLFLVE